VEVIVVGYDIWLAGATDWVAFLAILVFSVREMLASPRSREYAGRSTPPEKAGMSMGHLHWRVGLSNLFGGLVSSVAFQHFGPQDTNHPNAMWVLFVVLAVTTAVGLVVYNRFVVLSIAQGVSG
jgi:POT family proton-dependent oligopeptide transporter